MIQTRLSRAAADRSAGNASFPLSDPCGFLVRCRLSPVSRGSVDARYQSNRMLPSYAEAAHAGFRTCGTRGASRKARC